MHTRKAQKIKQVSHLQTFDILIVFRHLNSSQNNSLHSHHIRQLNKTPKKPKKKKRNSPKTKVSLFTQYSPF